MNRFLSQFGIIIVGLVFSCIAFADAQDCTIFVNSTDVHCTFTHGLGTDKLQGYWVKLSARGLSKTFCINDRNSMTWSSKRAEPGQYKGSLSVCQSKQGGCIQKTSDDYRIYKRNGKLMSNPAIARIAFNDIPNTFEHCALLVPKNGRLKFRG